MQKNQNLLNLRTSLATFSPLPLVWSGSEVSVCFEKDENLQRKCIIMELGCGAWKQEWDMKYKKHENTLFD